MNGVRLGRALGAGTLGLVRREGGPARWTLSWTDAQGRRRKQALSTDRRAAETLRSQIIAKRDLEVAGLGGVVGMNTPLAELRELYAADLKTRATPAHVTNTEQALDRILGLLRARTVRELRPVEVLQARVRLLDAGLAPRTVNVHVDRLRGMLTWGVDAGLIAENPLARIKRLPDGEGYAKRRRRALSDEEVARFLAAAEADDHENDERVRNEAAGASARTLRHRGMRVPQAPFWKFLVESACRYGEARAVAWSDVDLDRRIVTLRAETTKARKARSVPITRAMADELARLHELHLKRSPELGLVFLSPEGRQLSRPSNNVRRVFMRLIEAAGIERVDANGRQLDVHALRHTGATRFARNGAPLAVTQRILGHSDPKLTARVYTHLDVEDLREAVDAAGGAAANRNGPRRAALEQTA